MESRPAVSSEEIREEERDVPIHNNLRTPTLEEYLHFPEDFPPPAYFEA